MGKRAAPRYTAISRLRSEDHLRTRGSWVQFLPGAPNYPRGCARQPLSFGPAGILDPVHHSDALGDKLQSRQPALPRYPMPDKPNPKRTHKLEDHLHGRDYDHSHDPDEDADHDHD